VILECNVGGSFGWVRRKWMLHYFAPFSAASFLPPWRFWGRTPRLVGRCNVAHSGCFWYPTRNSELNQ
jgi:hypothetical protein